MSPPKPDIKPNAEFFEKIRKDNLIAPKTILPSAFRKMPSKGNSITDGPAPVIPVVPEPVIPPTTCFPVGSKVLMADGSVKNIEDVKSGDSLMTFDGTSTICVELDTPILGNRKMIEFEDKSFMWSEEHPIWTRNVYTGKQWWWSQNPDTWRAEVASGGIAGLKDNFSITYGADVEYATIDGWKLVKAKITDEHYDYFTQLYLPRTDGHPIIINGYLVSGGTNEWGCDYTKINWDGLLVKSNQLEMV